MKMTQAKKKAFWQSLPATPYILWMALFIIIPLGMVVFFALTDPQGNFTLENIARGGEHMGVLLRSIKLAAIATALCVLIAYPLAYILSRKKGFQKQTLFIMVMLPMWMNFLLRTFAWMTILENNGLINKFLGLFGIGPLQMINTQGAVILGMVYNYIPFMILPIYTTMCKIGDDVIEAAQDLGGNTFQVMARVVIPLSLPGVSTGITMVFVPAISTFIISKMLGGGTNQLIGDIIELQFLGNSYNPNLGSAISLVLMVVVLLCMSIMSNFDDEEMEGRILSRKNRWLSSLYVWLVMLFLYAPIAVLIVFSFNDSKSRNTWTGFTLRWYEELFHDRVIIQSFVVMLVVAIASSVVATLLGTLAAIGLNKMNKKLKSVVMTFTYLPMINPEIITGVALMLLFIYLKMEFGMQTLIISHITFNVPYVILNVLPKLRQMDQNTYDAALDLGCNPFTAFTKVVIPEIMPGIVSGFLMALTYSMDDFVISYFVSGASIQTLPVAIYSMTRRRVSPKINALSTIMFAVVLLVLLVYNILSSRKAKAANRSMIRAQKEEL